MSKTWLVTGAARGLDVEVAKAAMRTGDLVAGTGCKWAAVNDSLGQSSRDV
jgi:NAD(P)-dependent dehydrogenase (short-subunit alcohol dehydrogenase family)